MHLLQQQKQLVISSIESRKYDLNELLIILKNKYVIEHTKNEILELDNIIKEINL